MTEGSLNAYLGARQGDPAIRLLAEATAAMRTDAAYLADGRDGAGGAFLAEEAPAELGPDALARVLARIEAAAAQDERAQRAGDDPLAAELARLPSPVREAALRVLEHDRWRIGGPGVRRLPLGLGDTHCELMRIEPGRGAADHDHDGDELTLVLAGGYHDGHAGYGPGDVSLARPGFSHAPTADPGEPCYVLAVTFGPPRFSGLIGWVQKLTGFPWEPKPAPRR